MPDLSNCELAYWDGWNAASYGGSFVTINPYWEVIEQWFWDGWNAKLAHLQDEVKAEALEFV